MRLNRSSWACLVLLCIIVNPIIATASDPWLLQSVDIDPTKGTVNTEITIFVRGDPFTGTPWTLYVFYDGKCLLSRIPDVQIGKTAVHEHRWDVVIKPPTELPYSSKNVHDIKVWVEDELGHRSIYTTEFKITKFIPPDSWWEQLAPAFIEEITGPTGEKGEPGIPGESITGPAGPRGPEGQGIQGEMGPQGPIGLGGTAGKDSNSIFAYIAFLMSCFALIIGVYLLWKKR